MSAYKLSAQQHIPLEEAEDIVNRYWGAAPNIQQYQKRCIRQAKKEGTVYNYFGRPRRVRYYMNHSEGKKRSFGDRTVKNTQIQSIGGEILKVSLIKLFSKVYYNPEFQGNATFHSTIHDEINSIVTDDYLERVIPVILDTMTMKIKGWELPFTVGLEIGDSWGNCFAFNYSEGLFTPDWSPTKD